MDHLKADTIYEFRFNCSSSTGASKWSYPSRRAKTNKIRAPQAFNPPVIVKVQDLAVTLKITAPLQSPEASPVLRIHIDTKDVIKKTSSHIKSVFDVAFDGKYIIEPLRLGGSYQFRVLGESIQGKGPVSQWSETAAIPMHKHKR
jgi:hypothetical protein